jgi:delta 1-pyrroline-5-carboxylate dehydrogenase
MLMFNNLIDGEWMSDGARSPNVNPSDTNDIVGEAVRGTRAQADAAVAAAKAAYPAWSSQCRSSRTTTTGCAESSASSQIVHARSVAARPESSPREPPGAGRRRKGSAEKKQTTAT